MDYFKKYIIKAGEASFLVSDLIFDFWNLEEYQVYTILPR